MLYSLYTRDADRWRLGLASLCNIPLEQAMAKQILLVDDEPQLLYSLTEYFDRMGFDAVSAESGTEALGLLVENPPDLIVSDILMEEMDGYEFQRRVNALTGESIPFIFLTAKADPKDRVVGLQEGADDYITKPFNPEELIARIKAILHRVEQTRREEQRVLDAMRARLLDQVSAQLRAPANSLYERVKLISTESSDISDIERQRYMREALSQAREFCQLIDDFSWAATGIEDETLAREPNRIAPLLRAAASSVAPLAEERGVELGISCGGLLTGNVNAPALTRALEAILESIITIAPRGTSAKISATRSGEGGIEFVVTGDAANAILQDEEISEQAACDAISDPIDALALARYVVRGHRGRLGVQRSDDGTQSYVIWIPGHVVRHVGKRD